MPHSGAETKEAPFAMTDAAIDAIATRVAEMLNEIANSTAEPLVDAEELARRFGVSRSFVYAHAAELGAIRLGGGRRARLRFDARAAAQAIATRDRPAGTREPVKSRPTRKRRAPVRTDVPLLAVHGL